MFLKTFNGYLINLNNISKILIVNEEPFYKAVAYFTEKGETKEITLYKDVEQQYVNEYVDDLAKKIAIKVGI